MGWVLPMTLVWDPGSPSRVMEGHCQNGILGTPLRTNMRRFPASLELGLRAEDSSRCSGSACPAAGGCVD